MIQSKREVVESPIYQGEDEALAYSVTTTPWGSSPSSVTVALKTLPEMKDVSSINLSGSASVVGDVITTPTVSNLQAGKRYRLEVKFTTSGQVWECWCEITGDE
jgi:hypothetical protein